jgi:hypothetical protein
METPEAMLIGLVKTMSNSWLKRFMARKTTHNRLEYKGTLWLRAFR